MEKKGVLLSFYSNHDDAHEAYRRLRRSRFQRIALIHGLKGGETQVVKRSGRLSLIASLLMGALLGILFGYFLITSLNSSAESLLIIIPLTFAVLGSLAGGWGIRRMRRGIDPEVIEWYAKWIVEDESLTLLQDNTSTFTRAVPILRRIGETAPSIFIVRGEAEFPIDLDTTQTAPLSAPQILKHAERMALEQSIEPSTGRDEPLLERLSQAEEILTEVCLELSESQKIEPSIGSSAEWLLDNSYIIEGHISDVRLNLPSKFYHELPVLSQTNHMGVSSSTRSFETAEPQKGEPRVFSLAAELVLHTDGRVDRDIIEQFLAAYQTESTLATGELWAAPLTLRIALIDRLSRLAVGVDSRMRARERADYWANRLLIVARRAPQQLFSILAALAEDEPNPSPYFASQLTGHLYDEESALVPVQSWLERTLKISLADLNIQEQNRLAADQVSIGNAITSLRNLSLLDWREVFETQSRVEDELRRDPAKIYSQMDFDTRDRYRGVVEEIAREARISEVTVAKKAVELGRIQSSRDVDLRYQHIGYYLVDQGREDLLKELQSKDSVRSRRLRWILSHHTSIYLTSIASFTALFVIIAVWLTSLFGVDRPLELVLIALAAALPASQLAIQSVNYWITRILPPQTLPKMYFEKTGIPDAFRTLIVVPILIIDPEELKDEIGKLEVRFLANKEPNLVFGLFTDYSDSDVQVQQDDGGLLKVAEDGIRDLNKRHGENRFYLFHRDREWCDSEGKFIGWERKRGKLEELNQLLNGEMPRSEGGIVKVGEADQLEEVRYVITLDSDTQLPRGSARRMIETIAHPLNRRVSGPDSKGYTIIQPRVSTALPSAQATNFSRLFTDPVGSDPYTKAVSDVYQDLSSEGSYIGKGIYDPRSFYEEISGRFPEQTLLSHDLIEGAYVRVGLASDIELFDEFPPDYQTYTRRQHRWIRGDWQIAAWILPRVRRQDGARIRNPLSYLNRWKIFDNLRRSLIPLGSVVFLLTGWLLSPGSAAVASLLIALLLLYQPLTEPVTWATTASKSRVLNLKGFSKDLSRSIVEIGLLLYQAALALDAITRVLYRRIVSHKNFLEWTTAQVASRSAGGGSKSFRSQMRMVFLTGVILAALVTIAAPRSLLFALPFLMLWFVSPALGYWLNRPADEERRKADVRSEDRIYLRRIARKTWRYFDDFVNVDSRWLPPDNYQVSHQNQLAMRTSPTNMGLWLLSLLGAYDFGYITLDQVIDRVGGTLGTLAKLEKHEGHFLNWYNLKTLTPLEPRYVSSVDSGNFLSSLWALEQGLNMLVHDPIISNSALLGMRDTLQLLRESVSSVELDEEAVSSMQALENLLTPSPNSLYKLIMRVRSSFEFVNSIRDQVIVAVPDDHEANYWAQKLGEHSKFWNELIDRYFKWVDVLESEEAQEFENPQGAWAMTAAPSLWSLAKLEMTDLLKTFVESPLSTMEFDQSDLPGSVLKEYAQAKWFAGEILGQVNDLIEKTRAMAGEMNMAFLYDEEHALFTIGYNVSTQSYDNSYYDLIASEARLGSFAAIARGDVPSEHWLALNRPYGTVGRHSVLLSWSGTMFEYLMPLLLLDAYPNSLLDAATKEAVSVQVEYGARRGVPWGISESAFADLDLNKTYQYKAFGVPGLGLRRGLEEELVVAPYASLLALAIEPNSSIENLHRLSDLGMDAEFGYFEAIDFSRQRQREGDRGVHVRAYMAHHQAMSFLAIDNFLHHNVMRKRFHADPRVKATEPLLYERIPVSPPQYQGTGDARPPARLISGGVAPSVSKFDTPHTPTPKTQLLSNRRYNLMVTNSGGGYSRWDDIQITRWRADTTRDPWGTFCYIRAVDSGNYWSNTYQPVGGSADEYTVNFAIDRAKFHRRDNGIETETEIIISPEDDVEIRRITLLNRSLRARRLELTSYIELAMASQASDRQHPAFNKLFIETESVPSLNSLLAHRRIRDEDDPQIFVGHRMTVDGDVRGSVQYETDRGRFIGRGRSVRDPAALQGELSNTTGHVLDPILSLRHEITLKPGERIECSFILGASETRVGILSLLEKYGDINAIERSFELTWARSQLELRTLRIQPDEARRFQKLASFMIYPSARFRPPPERLVQNNKGQSSLWAYGLSGDLPIAIVTIGEARDVSLVRQMLQAHTYWRHHGLTADLLVLNEESSSYDQPLNERLTRLIQAHSMYTGIDQPGGVFLRNVDQIPDEDLTLLLASANVSLVAARGPLAQQLSAPHDVVDLPEKISISRVREEPSAQLPFLELPYFNSIGGFTPDGREYAIYLAPGVTTPAPWVNVMANPQFGALVSESGSGYTWYGNSQRNRLTDWSNDPVVDPPADAIYIRDEESGVYWSPTPQPIRELDAYRTRHGAGYSTFEHNSHAIEQVLTTFVPMTEAGGDPVRIQRLHLKNDSSKTRRLSVTFYTEWTLGEFREGSYLHVATNWDTEVNAILARNRYHPEYSDRIAFATLTPAPKDYTADRHAFLGRNRSLSEPAAMERIELSGRVGAGLDACAALRTSFELAPGESEEVICIMGQAASIDEARSIILKFREDIAVHEALQITIDWWDQKLGVIQVEVPDLSIGFLLNRWLLYQSLSSRIWGRTGFYQSGGAFGFRDQLQDVLAWLYSNPIMARKHILKAAARQFREGDVQHWWHPPSGAGIRSRISDDLLWLPYAVSQYVSVTGDLGILEERIPFLEAEQLSPEENEAYIQPEESIEHGDLYEHCRRAIDRGYTQGPHGLPLIGIGDWNDGMNRVGVEGRGESVWLAWFLIDVLGKFSSIADQYGKPEDALEFRQRMERLEQAVESEGWDGEWYRRGYFDDGTPLGSAINEEARIDSLPQSWAWISGAGPAERASRGLESAWRHLVREDEGLVLLFTPPFDKSPLEPGYIKGYPPGVRENGGQYTHAALWLAMAFARMGDGDRAAKILRILNPIEHARSPEEVRRYVVEPYVVPADVYRLPGKIGRGGWTWYTGSASWMYRIWIEEILGFKLEGSSLRIEPELPHDWEGFRLQFKFGEAVYDISVDNVTSGIKMVEVDGKVIEGGVIQLEKRPIKHRVKVTVGHE